MVKGEGLSGLVFLGALVSAAELAIGRLKASKPGGLL
jgi:hypothetical protein